MASLAQMERGLLAEAPRAGLAAAARRPGRVGGRKRRMTPGKVESARSSCTVGWHPGGGPESRGLDPDPVSLVAGIESVSRRPRDGRRYWTAVSVMNRCFFAPLLSEADLQPTHSRHRGREPGENPAFRGVVSGHLKCLLGLVVHAKDGGTRRKSPLPPFGQSVSRRLRRKQAPGGGTSPPKTFPMSTSAMTFPMSTSAMLRVQTAVPGHSQIPPPPSPPSRTR